MTEVLRFCSGFATLPTQVLLLLCCTLSPAQASNKFVKGCFYLLPWSMRPAPVSDAQTIFSEHFKHLTAHASTQEQWLEAIDKSFEHTSHVVGVITGDDFIGIVEQFTSLRGEFNEATRRFPESRSWNHSLSFVVDMLAKIVAHADQAHLTEAQRSTLIKKMQLKFNELARKYPGIISPVTLEHFLEVQAELNGRHIH